MGKIILFCIILYVFYVLSHDWIIEPIIDKEPLFHGDNILGGLIILLIFGFLLGILTKDIFNLIKISIKK